MRLLGTLALWMALWGAPGPVLAQNNSPRTLIAPAASASTVPKPPADSAMPAASPNPIIPDSSRNALSDQDSTAAPSPHKSRSDTVLVVKHSFNHRQQIIAGSVIMTCLMFMMVTMNNYNPR